MNLLAFLHLNLVMLVLSCYRHRETNLRVGWM
jgi:hypothetical protein